MRSSYGFKKFLQAIYVVFERIAIVTSHDAGVVSASRARLARDASSRVAARALDGTRRAMRIFIEKNRLFCASRRCARGFARFFARRRAIDRVRE